MTNVHVFKSHEHPPKIIGISVFICDMVMPQRKQPKSSGLSILSSSSVLDAVNSDAGKLSNYNVSSDSDEDSDVEVVSAEMAENITKGEGSTSTISISARNLLLNALRAPRSSDLTRKRKLQCNPGKRKKSRLSSGNSEPKVLSQTNK